MGVERFKPHHLLPISFVLKIPLVIEEAGDNYNKSITVELDIKTTVEMTPYIYLRVKNFLGYQAEHDYILSQQKAKINWVKMEKLHAMSRRNF